MRELNLVGRIHVVGDGPEADVERLLEMQCDRGADLLEGFALLRQKQGEGIAMLFDADRPGCIYIELDVLGVSAALAAKLQCYQARTVPGSAHILAARVKCLAKHQDALAMRVGLVVVGMCREGDIGRQHHVAGHLLPQVMEVIDVIPGVGAGGRDEGPKARRTGRRHARRA